MKQFQIVIRCEAEPGKHAKILRFNPNIGIDFCNILARLIDGTSLLYIHKPGPDSPIGKCATCGGKYNATVEEIEVDDAEPKRKCRKP